MSIDYRTFVELKNLQMNLENTKKNKCQFLMNIVKRLGMKVESFMHFKDAEDSFEAYVVTISEKQYSNGLSEEEVLQIIYKDMINKVQFE